jgi:hypothetical protein
MRSAGIRCDKRRQQGCASKQASLRVSAPWRSQLIGSTLAAHAVRDLPLPTTGEGAILGPTTTPDLGNVGIVNAVLREITKLCWILDRLVVKSSVIPSWAWGGSCDCRR